MAQRARETQRPQVISADVAQVDVLLWLLKEGYKPTSREDEKRIERVMGGDPSLAVVSAPKGTKGMPKQWYIFEKEALYDKKGRQKEGIWDGANYGQPIHYMKSSLRIRLSKEIA